MKIQMPRNGFRSVERPNSRQTHYIKQTREQWLGAQRDCLLNSSANLSSAVISVSQRTPLHCGY
jgi:hypothetical protein